MRHTSHVWMSHVTCMNESCHTYESVTLHTTCDIPCTSHVTHMNESRYTCEWVMSHTWMSHVIHVNESCHTYDSVTPHTTRDMSCRFSNTPVTSHDIWHEWVMSHVWMSHLTYTNQSRHTMPCAFSNTRTTSHMWASHVTHLNETCSTYEQVIPHIWKSHFTCVKKSCHTRPVYTCIHTPSKERWPVSEWISAFENVTTHSPEPSLYSGHVAAEEHVLFTRRGGSATIDLKEVAACMYQSCGSCHTYVWVMSQMEYVMTQMSQVTNMNESCHKHTNVSGYKCEWANIWIHMDESCHVSEWVMWRMWRKRCLCMYQSWDTFKYTCMSLITYMNDTFTRVTCCIHMCDMGSFTCVTGLVHMCDTTHSCVRHE